MKFAELRGEQAIEAFADLLEPTVELFSDKEVANAFQDEERSKASLASMVLKKHPKAVLKILAIYYGKDAEDYNPSVFEIVRSLVEVFSDENVIGLFTSQGRIATEGASGSATENTEGNEN